MNSTFKSILKKIRLVVSYIGIAVLLALCLRIFVLASFKVPSYSMSPSILPGDYVYVNKLALGGRMYKNFDFMQGGKVEVFRVKGWSQVKRNDVLVFNFPYSDWTKLGFDLNVFYVKRCVAIPGDTFYIENGIYQVKNSPEILGCIENQKKLSKMPNEKIQETNFRCFPYGYGDYHWTMKTFGPLYVPRSGDTLHVDSCNIYLYKNLIRYETGREVQIQHDTVWLDTCLLKQYVFQKNYYFLAGDYIFDSRDSRYWGLLPEDHIVGKVAFIWKSKDPDTGKFRWNRFFKSVL